MARRHPQKYLRLSYETRRVPVDEDMAPIVLVLDELGIRSASCCQQSCGGWCGRKHRNGKRTKMCNETAYISFPSPTHAKKFMQAVYRQTDPERVRDHMFGHGSSRSKRWSWGFIVEDVNNYYADVKGKLTYFQHGKPSINFHPVITFPRTHIKLINERLQEALAKKTKRASRG